MQILYKNIKFDSELELEYYKHLTQQGTKFIYQNEFKSPIRINLGRRKNYTPDFVVYDSTSKTITITELKGYSKWSGNEDNAIMDFMKNKVETDEFFLIDWLAENGLYPSNEWSVDYKRLKHLKTYGFVEYDFKNPNSMINQKRAKIKLLEQENKELKNHLKEYKRYFNYTYKVKKLNKSQVEWLNNFIDKESVEVEK